MGNSASVGDGDLNVSESGADEIFPRRGQKYVIWPVQDSLDWQRQFLSCPGGRLPLWATSLLPGSCLSREPPSPMFLCPKTQLWSTTGGS